MRSLIAIIGLVFVSLTAKSLPTPSVAKYCNLHGSMMSVDFDPVKSDVQINLVKHNTSFTLIAKVGTISIGSRSDVGDLQALALSRNLIQDQTSILNSSSFGVSTLDSRISTIRSANILTEGETASGNRVVVLNSNGQNVFVGSTQSCHLQ